MKANVIGNCVVFVAICAAITLPMVIWQNADAESRARNETLRRQKETIDELTAANANRKKERAGRNSRALTDEQMKELLRLRAEAGALRRQTNDVARLQAENDFLQPKSSTDQPSQPKSRDELVMELSGELVDAAKNILAALPAARRKFADEHRGESASQLSELRNYFPSADGRRMPGLYSFRFVRDLGPQPGDTLILGESGEHPTPSGLPAKIYAFSDGQVVEIKAPDVEDVYKFFEDWEKQHLNPPLSRGQ